MSDARRSGMMHPLPPYLWVWLIIFIVTFPLTVNTLQILFSDAFSAAPLPGEDILPLGFLLRLPNFAELFPMLVVIIGVLSLTLPSLRQSYIQRKYDLKDDVQVSVVQEISGFVQDHLPDVSLSSNPLRGDQIAFIYPTGFRKSGLALMGGVAKFWKADNESARGILLHEIAHIRNGDTLITGAGSGFRALLNYWPVIFIVTVAVPGCIVWFAMSYLTFTELSGLASSGEIATYQFGQFLFFLLPSLFFMLLTGLLWAASVVFLPLAALWYSELAADCVASGCQGTPEPLIRALRLHSAPVSPWRWLLARTTHPPTRVRVFMLQQIPSPQTRMYLLILAFPAAMILSMLLTVLYYASFDLSVLWATQTTFSTATLVLPEVIGITAPLLVFVGFGILLWPSIVKFRYGSADAEDESTLLQWKRAHLGGGITTIIMAVLLPTVLIL